MRDAILLPVGPDASVRHPDYRRYAIRGVAEVADLSTAIDHLSRRLHDKRGTVDATLAALRSVAPPRARISATPHPCGLVTIDADFGACFGGYPVVYRLLDLLPIRVHMGVIRG